MISCDFCDLFKFDFFQFSSKFEFDLLSNFIKSKFNCLIDRLLEDKQNIFKSAHRKKTKQFQVFNLNNDEALAQPSTHPQHIYEAHIASV